MALAIGCLEPIYPKYDYQRTNRPKEACATYLTDMNPFNIPPAAADEGKQIPTPIPIPIPIPTVTPPPGSGQTVDWRGKSRGLFFHHPQGNINVICAQLSEDCKGPDPVICRERTRTRCTQTRYRESSAQTRPYQPEILGDKENYQQFEIYQISKLLDNCEPPGYYEAKVVERYRRRRQYEKALQTSLNDKKNHRTILEAMEWENWVAREEDIQRVQMLRMEIVTRMFNARQQRYQEMSEKRIQCSSKRIQAKRDHQLNKINIEYARNMRRLQEKKQKITKSYRKGNIVQEHIDPASDLHAPQMRFGVNPNRRHFIGFQKHFDDRIENLDKQRDEKGLAALICPFNKLRSWAKPKQRMKEVSQRFLNEENLKNLYESLRSLRTAPATSTKAQPKCPEKRIKTEKSGEASGRKENKLVVKLEPVRAGLGDQLPDREETNEHLPEEQKNDGLIQNLRHKRAKEMHSKTLEEISSIVREFEGTTLGRLLKFLNEELERLKQQKKFQTIHMLAQGERWKREAYEGGLRQRENKLREDNEKLLETTSTIHKDTASIFLKSVLEEEFEFTTEALAEEKISELAMEADRNDLEYLRTCGKEGRILNRIKMYDYVKNQVFVVAEKRLEQMNEDKMHEAELRAIEEELFVAVEKVIETEFRTPDSVYIVGELLDELIDDAVTYDFDVISSCSSEEKFDLDREINEIINKLLELATKSSRDKVAFTDSSKFETRLQAEHEAKALIRKLIRRAIPEERWTKEGDRIVQQTLSDTFYEAISQVECLRASRHVHADDRLQNIISEIYHRLKASEKDEVQESSDFKVSEAVRSIRSTIDIFDAPSELSSSESTDYTTFLEDQSIKTVHYVDPRDLPTFKPVDIGRRHERFNILGKVAKRYQREENGLKCDSDEDSSNSTEFFPELMSYPSRYLDLSTSRIFQAQWMNDMHPEIQGGNQRSSALLRSSGSYNRAQEEYDRLTGSVQESEETGRRSSL